MVNRESKEVIFTNTFNLLGVVDENFHQSIAYERYVNLPMEEKNGNKIWTTGLANAACVPTIFYFMGIVHLCAEFF